MLNIQVLGSGLIPRGLGIAPRKQPFLADYTLICTIMQTRGLTVNMINPEDGRSIPLNPQNVKRMWEKYKNVTPSKKQNVINKDAVEKKPEKKEPEVYNPTDKKDQKYQEVTKDIIQDAVNKAADKVFEAPKAEEKKEETPTEVKPEEEKVEEKAEEKKEEVKTTPTQSFKPINNNNKK